MTRPGPLAVAGYLLAWMLVVQWATEVLGWLFRWPAAFGGWPLGEGRLYWPGQFLTWFPILAPGDRWVLWAALGLCLAALAAILFRLVLPAPRQETFGADRWATETDVRRAGILRRGRP